MGLRERFRRNPKTKAKSDLKQNLKDIKWNHDYNQALKDLGAEPKALHGGSGSANGRYYGSNSGGAKWPFGLSSDGQTRHIDHYRMRQNARNAFHDSLDARGIIERTADLVADIGLVLEATPDSGILNLTPEQSETWAADVERRFNLWAKDKKQHRSGTMSFYQAQRLYEIGQQRDNDNFMRLYYSNKKKLQSPLQFEFIDPNQVRGYSYTSTYGQYGYDDGITRDSDGTEKAYKIWVSDKSPGKQGQVKDITIPRVGVKSGRLMMIHGFNPEYPGQGRGYSRLGFAIQEIENLTDFTSAAIKKAINQSNMVMSVENQQDDPGNPYEGNTLDRESVLGRPPVTPEALVLLDNFVVPEVCPIPEVALDTPGSTAFVGNAKGDSIKLLETKAPGDNFKEFISTFTERLGAAYGISQEVVLMKFGQNYSASRATLLLTWRMVEMWRLEMATDFLNPTYESWLSEEIAAGRVSAPGWNDPILRAAWLLNAWIGSSIPAIDPKKEADARKVNLEMNLTTAEREARNFNGTDIKLNIERNKKTFPEMVPPYWAAPVVQESDESEDDEADNE